MHDGGFPGVLTPRRSQNEALQVRRRGNYRYSQGAPGRDEGCRSDPDILCLRAVYLPLAGQIGWYDSLRGQPLQAARRGEYPFKTHGGRVLLGQADARECDIKKVVGPVLRIHGYPGPGHPDRRVFGVFDNPLKN
jgi:hypothetical protein